MANRRFGGGPPQRGGRPFPQQQQYQGNSVSPWQGGVAPNNSGGLLSQLSAPQQIALALTSLLQPQQQQGNSNPPSLLSLNTSPFSNQDNFGNQSRFNRGHSDFRRLEPYNKVRLNQNWRAETNRPKPGGYPNFNRNRGSNKDRRRSPQKDNRPPFKPNRSPAKSESKERIPNEKPEENTEAAVDEPREEEKEKKRDWKEEKNVSEEVEMEQDGPKREGRYQGVPASLLHCFVCNKSMWDGESFQNHIRGKAHKQMLQSLEESFQITVNILRENMRLVEEKKLIELNRMHRHNKNYGRKMNESQSTCNMCDLKFMGKIIIHRKTEGHQRLKKFLHPKCEVCKQEFPARMEWVEHRFTPEHLRKVNEVNETKVGGVAGSVVAAEESFEVNLEPLLDEPLQTESEKPILELSEDLINLQNRIPGYKKTRPVSKESVKPVSGFLCELCDRFLISEEMSNAHLRSERHYLAFVEAVKSKYKRIASEKAETEEENSKRIETEEPEAEVKQENDPINGGSEMYDPEEACNDDGEEGNKIVKEEQEEEETWDEVNAIDNSGTEETETAETEIQQEIKEEPQEEAKVGMNTRPKRGIKAGCGAGPKSKKLRKTVI